jgi:tRNA(Ile)-lysidine synthase TilS/MesJ
MMFFYPQDNIAAANFLETPLEEILAARSACSLCRRCRAQALHRYCNVYNTGQIEADG